MNESIQSAKVVAADLNFANEKCGYEGRELEAMDEARNYHLWILRVFEPFLGAHLVEVGAGVGSFSKLILSRHDCQSLALVEPSRTQYEQLAIHSRSLATRARLELYNTTFAEAAPIIKARQVPDSVIYVNVLEHIADDEAELATIRQTLSDGGHALIFVPALPWLYGAFDQHVGHFRRYKKSELEEKLRRAGFEIVKTSYFDFPGIAPWLIKYCLLRSQSMEPAAVRLYDRLVVPVVSRMELRLPPPIGKNLLAIAAKR